VRILAVALATALLASLGALGPASVPSARAAGGVKVAIIVGATHGATPQYRDYANQLYAEAIKYSDNVVKVYSPNATASRVKSAVNGASVIVYLGHGNGWPSPYTFDPNYTTKNGFGLNADLNNDGRTTDYENKYYGEPWIRDLRPAPNAVVLLFHLCYASGNSEPGHGEPSLSTARKRVDNYAAAFLKAGARAVIASGHSHDPYYISGLFTTRQTIEEYWRNSPDANGNFASYPSERNPGMTLQMDPDRPGAYYRSIAGKMSLTTREVTGAAYADTSRDPATMVVPGNATPASDGAPVYDSVDAAQQGWTPAATLAASDHVRVEWQEWATSWADGSPIYRVSSGQVEGWMTGSSLVPRDSAAPQTWEVDDGAGTFSPNGDGEGDTITVAVRISESTAWTLRIRGGGETVLERADGEGDRAAITWAPSAGSVPEGTYRWTLEATDGWGNGPLLDEGSFTVDLTPPQVSVVEAEGEVPQFSPNGDGASDSVRFRVASNEAGTALATVRTTADEVVARVSAALGTDGVAVAWDGRNEAGAYVPDGEYEVSLAARDLAGNRSEWQVRTTIAYGALGYTAASAPAFFPQDGDTLASSVTFSFRLRDVANVTWSVQDEAGTVLRTIRSGEDLAPGTFSFAWDGRTDAGTMVPRGAYRAVVMATNGTWSSTQRASVTADAFRIVLSDTTLVRGQKLTVTVTSAESLDGAPRLRVSQPGLDTWGVTMNRVEGRVYRVTITLKGGKAGALRLKVVADDSRGSTQASSVTLDIR
jgi:flagellar hook assembly protein FlgD